MNGIVIAGVLLGLALVPRPLRAQAGPGNFPSLEPDPRAAHYAQRGEAAAWEDLAEIALWASAVGEAEEPSASPASLRRAAEELREELLVEFPSGAGPRERGDYILSFAHRKFLRSYSATQTRLDTLLTNGRYNCVSSAVLYLILAQSQGLEARGVATRDHAFAVVLGDNESWDVETTNPYGFDPGNRREFHDQFGKLTGFAYVPARNYRDRTTLSPLELVSLILHNRIAELERRGRYDQSVPLALNRAELLAERRDPAVSGFFTDPRRDLRDRLLNYGASLLNAGKEEEGLRWAVYAEPSYTGAGGGEDPRWGEYIQMLASNRTAKLCRAGRFTEARDFLTENGALLDPAGRRKLETQIADGELSSLVQGIKQAADTPDITARITEAESAGLLPAPRARELRNHVSLWRATDFHNRFAGAFNRRDYTLARRILEEALGEFPDNRRLLNDRGVLERTAPEG